MARRIELKIPTTKEKVRELNICDEVYVSGRMYNMRGSLLRLARLAKTGGRIPEALREGLRDGAFHYSGPIVKGKKIVSNSSTHTYGAAGIPLWVIESVIEDFGVRIIVGKEGLVPEATDLLKKHGVAYLATIVGAGVLYAYPAIKKITHIFWKNMGMAEACYEMELDSFGPAWVGIDAHGKSAYENVERTLEKKRRDIYQELGWAVTSYNRRTCPNSLKPE